MNRRSFLKTTSASATAFTIVPRYVLGGPNQVAPSAKINLAYIGCGTQGLTEMVGMLTMPEVQIVAVCDPNRESNDYIEWGRDSVRRTIANGLGLPEWRKGSRGAPGGREVGREIVEIASARNRGTDRFDGCKVYSDFRDLLEKETEVDAVKIMTPDHLHACIAVAAMRKGKHVLMHKPLANRVREARWVIETARETKVATHFLPARSPDDIRLALEMVEKGAIGGLEEVHNWSNRPMWPQYPAIPTDRPPIPDGFDWELWQGPALSRPFHPHYTHAVFRGWYEFGGGSIADMGHYSLWPVFRELDLDAPVLVESTPSHVCTIVDGVSSKVRNDYSFPSACTIRFKFAAKGDRPAIDLFWYDGGMRPATPEELEGSELAPEGMMFVGKAGKIIAGFRGENPRLIPESKNREYRRDGAAAAPREGRSSARNAGWVEAFRGGAPTYGDFLLAGPISEAFNLGAVSLRLGGKRLVWDAAQMKITNLSGAEKYLSREYRKGWEPV